jgi:hypothetical protein
VNLQFANFIAGHPCRFLDALKWYRLTPEPENKADTKTLLALPARTKGPKKRGFHPLPRIMGSNCKTGRGTN